MRTLEPANRLRIGLMGLVVTVLAVGVGQTFTSVPMLFAPPNYYGQFTDTGQLNKGDKVRIAGVDVGQVQAIKIDGDHIVMKFSTGSNTIGTESRLAIKTDTILGKKVLEIEPRGTQTLRPNGVLPLGQSTTPYQIYDAFFDVTKAAAGWNIDTVKQSLNVLSQTIDQTYPHLSAALKGVADFSDTIGKRDEQVTHLLAQANQIASILGDRSQQIDRLFVNSNDLLAAFNQRSQAISALLSNVSAFSAQVQYLINDNPNLNHVLEQLRTVSDLLEKHKDDLADRSNRSAKTSYAQRGCRVGTVLQGIAEQPVAVLDIAAVGGCGVQEAWHRSGGLLAQRGPAGVPVPRPQRHPVPQWCAAAGTSGSGGHPGSSGTGRGPGLARARTRRRRNCCPGRGTRCRALASIKTRVPSGLMGPTRCCPTSLRHRRTPTACPQHRGSRSPDGRGPAARRTGHTGADRAGTARGAQRAAGTSRSGSATVDVRARAATRTRRRHRDPAGSCRLRSSRPVSEAGR